MVELSFYHALKEKEERIVVAWAGGLKLLRPRLFIGHISLMSRKAQLETAYKAAVDEISALCRARQRPLPTLVAVSKYKPADDIRVLYDLGQRHFGENYVQELQEKARQLPQDIQWHFIGNLQSSKVKIAREIPNLAFVETLDSAAKASKLDAQRAKIDAAPLNIYIQVNTSEEPQKSGIIGVDEIEKTARHILAECPHLNLTGLMTIGSFDQSHAAGKENKDFARLVTIRDELAAKLNIELGLSMGMSADYLQAIDQGSTNVRIGSSIFGARQTKDEIKQAKPE